MPTDQSIVITKLRTRTSGFNDMGSIERIIRSKSYPKLTLIQADSYAHLVQIDIDDEERILMRYEHFESMQSTSREYFGGGEYI